MVLKKILQQLLWNSIHNTPDNTASDADDETVKTLENKTTVDEADVKEEKGDDGADEDNQKDKTSEDKETMNKDFVSEEKASEDKETINKDVVREEKNNTSEDKETINKDTVKSEKDYMEGKKDQKEEVDDKDAADDEFADLVPNEGNYRGSSRTDLHYDDVAGEDECPEQPGLNKEKEQMDGENRCKFFYVSKNYVL